jgi:hypothetical protein
VHWRTSPPLKTIEYWGLWEEMYVCIGALLLPSFIIEYWGLGLGRIECPHWCAPPSTTIVLGRFKCPHWCASSHHPCAVFSLEG